jgi:hypothetical protein
MGDRPRGGRLLAADGARAEWGRAGFRHTSVDPTSGRPGSAVTILGFGFTTNNKVAIGSTSIRHVSIAWAAGINCVRASDTCHPGINQALIINVPTTAAAGRYEVSVENRNGVSNAITFVVEEGS